MYKNIIFDFGGVVVQFNPKDFLMDHFVNKRAEEIVYELTFGSQEWQDLDRGIITREEGNAAMLENAARVNRVFEVQTVIDEWPTILRTKESTVHTMQKLKAAGYRLYYLTNIPADIMDDCASGKGSHCLTAVLPPVRCTCASRNRPSIPP